MAATGADDWLQSFLANFGAGQPGGAPGPYSGGPQGYMPGGGLMGRQQGQPAPPGMGYPAMGQPGQGQAPAGAGMSLMSSPYNPLNWLIGSAQAKEPQMGEPPFKGPLPAPVLQGDNGGGQPPPPADRPPPPDQGPAPIGDYNERVGNYPMWPTPPVPTQDTSKGTNDYPLPPRRPKDLGSPASPATAKPTPNLGYYKGFVPIDRVNANPNLPQPMRGQQTALDLSHLFRRTA